MSIHPGWKKMLSNRVLSEIENNRQKRKQKIERFDTHISNNEIFNDLDYVFSHIEGYKKLYIKLFEDMSEFNFIKTSSVTDGNDNLKSDFGEVKLYNHTLNSFKQMVLLINDNHDYQIQKDLYLLIALLHDFGKSHELCEYYKINLNDKHHIRSAIYFKKIIENNEEDYFGIDEASFKIILNTLHTHHSLINREEKETSFLIALKKADGSARKLEKETLLKGSTK